MVDNANLASLRVALDAAHASAVAKLANAIAQRTQFEKERDVCLQEAVAVSPQIQAAAHANWTEWNRKKAGLLQNQINEWNAQIEDLRRVAQICHARMEAANYLEQTALEQEQTRQQRHSDNAGIQSSIIKSVE